MTAGGSADAIVLLLRHGASVECRSENDTSPLLVAVASRQIEAVRIILSAGADPDTRDGEGDSPLRVSVANRDLAMTSLLLACGTVKSVNESGGPRGMTALGLAAWHLDLAMVKTLIGAGADPRVLDSDYRLASDRMPPRESANSRIWDEVRTTLGD